MTAATTDSHYTPSPEVINSQKEFETDRFGIFIHWGIYSMFARGEWYLNYGPKADEYAKAAKGFYPADFDASAWVSAIKDSGARYICFTTRHHDGFSMFHTAESDYNIVDATPFKRDVLKELSDECRRQDMKLHLILFTYRLDTRRLSVGTHRKDNRQRFAQSRLASLLCVHEPPAPRTPDQLRSDTCCVVRRMVGP